MPQTIRIDDEPLGWRREKLQIRIWPYWLGHDTVTVTFSHVMVGERVWVYLPRRGTVLMELLREVLSRLLWHETTGWVNRLVFETECPDSVEKIIRAISALSTTHKRKILWKDIGHLKGLDNDALATEICSWLVL